MDAGSDVEASDARSGRWRRFAAHLGLLAFGILTGLALGELVLRVGGYSPEYVSPWAAFHRSHPEYGYLGKADLDVRWRSPNFDVRIRHDGRGFRRMEHASPEARHDLYVFGDSFTWGWGVDQGETFSDLLALRLPAFRVHNLGVLGSGTVLQYRIFERVVRPELAPGDLVLLAFYMNDLTDNVSGGTAAVVGGDGEFGFDPPETFVSGERFIDRFYLFNLIAFRWNYAREVRWLREIEDGMRELGSAPGGAQRALPDDHEQMVVARHYLEAFRAETAAAGARFVVAYLADLWEYEPDLPEDHPRLVANRVVRLSFFRLADQLGLETIDLLPAFRTAREASDDPPLVYGVEDVHWTPRGHGVAAEVIASGLRALGGAGS